MNFPVVLKTSVVAEPRENLYYEIAANGAYQVRNTAAYRAVTRVSGPVPGLLPEAEHVTLRFPRLPRPDVEDVLAFFAEVNHLYRGEAIVILLYHTELEKFRITVPPQVLPGDRRHDGCWRALHAVRYGSVPRPPGFVRFGTIHSHADLPAYASADDDRDEQYEDGLHVVFGSFDARELSISASFVANGVRFPLAPSDVLETCVLPDRAARSDWMACVKTADSRTPSGDRAEREQDGERPRRG